MTDITVIASRRDRADGELTITVGGREITGWEQIEVTLRAEAFPNTFDITMSSQQQVDATAIAGASCSVRLGNDLVITGYVDRDVTGFAEGSHSIQLMGRGKTQDLVDCSGEWPSGQLTSVDALEIARTLADPYGINVELGQGAAAGDKVPQWNLNYGETGAEIIQRVARNAGLLAYEDASGTLILGRVGSTRAASGVAYGHNAQAWSCGNSMDARFSDVVCCSEALNLLQDLAGSDFYDVENDPYVPRHRLMYIVLEAVADHPQEFTITKARWEVARRAGRARVVQATVDSWRDSAGTLWTPNTLVPVDLPGNRAGTPLVLSEVAFRRSNETGTTADLTLMLPDAFTPEPITLQPVSTADIAPAPAS